MSEKDRLYSKKKSQTYSERSEEKRQAYLEEIANINPEKIVYVDESGMNDNDFYPHAYSAVGSRHYEAHPGHYTKRISMIGGLCNQNFMAPFIFEGHCNTQVFELYVEQVLVTVLKKDMLVVIDNARFHKCAKIRSLIEANQAKLLYLPPYSPDLNPIEHYWHKIKTAIRKLRRDTTVILDEVIGIVLKNMAES